MTTLLCRVNAMSNLEVVLEKVGCIDENQFVGGVGLPSLLVVSAFHLLFFCISF